MAGNPQSNFPTLKGRHLPPALQAELQKRGFSAESSTACDSSNPATADAIGDSQVSCRIQQSGTSLHFRVGSSDDTVYFYVDKPGLKGVLQPAGQSKISGISSYFKSADTPGCKTQWPRPMAQIFEEQERLAKAGYEMLPSDVTREYAKPGDTTSLLEEISGRVYSPATTFLRRMTARLGPLMQAKALREIENQIYPFLVGMKSIHTYESIGREVSRISVAKSAEVVLCPAASFNVGAIGIAMGDKRPSIKSYQFIFTGISSSEEGGDLQAPAQIFRILKEWAKPENNSGLVLLTQNEQGEPIPSKTKEGKRVQYRLLYQGKEITITYAIDDSGPGTFFHPDDLRQATHVVIHDHVNNKRSDMDLFMDVYLELLKLPADAPAKVVSAPNEFDRNSFRQSLISFGQRIPGGFACSDPIYTNEKDLGYYGGLNEIGDPGNKSAIVFSTTDPLIQKSMEIDRERSERWYDPTQIRGVSIRDTRRPLYHPLLDFMIQSGGITQAEQVYNPRWRFHHEQVYEKMPRLFRWTDEMLEKLSGVETERQRRAISLGVANLLAMYVQTFKERRPLKFTSKLVSPRLRSEIVRNLKEVGLLKPSTNWSSFERLLESPKRNEEFLKGLQEAILHHQDHYHRTPPIQLSAGQCPAPVSY